jgi:hypothetical protein
MVILTTSYEVCLARLSDRKVLVPYPDDRDKGEALLKKSVDLFTSFAETLHPFHNHNVQCIHEACEAISQAQNIVDTILQKVNNQ